MYTYSSTYRFKGKVYKQQMTVQKMLSFYLAITVLACSSDTPCSTKSYLLLVTCTHSRHWEQTTPRCRRVCSRKCYSYSLFERHSRRNRPSLLQPTAEMVTALAKSITFSSEQQQLYKFCDTVNKVYVLTFLDPSQKRMTQVSVFFDYSLNVTVTKITGNNAVASNASCSVICRYQPIMAFFVLGNLQCRITPT